MFWVESLNLHYIWKAFKIDVIHSGILYVYLSFGVNFYFYCNQIFILIAYFSIVYNNNNNNNSRMDFFFVIAMLNFHVVALVVVFILPPVGWKSLFEIFSGFSKIFYINQPSPLWTTHDPNSFNYFPQFPQLHLWMCWCAVQCAVRFFVFIYNFHLFITYIFLCMSFCVCDFDYPIQYQIFWMYFRWN